MLGRAARRRRRPDALHALRLRAVRLPGSGRQQHVRGGERPAGPLRGDGDRLAFAKAKALADNLTVVQNALDGLIPTSLDVREGAKNRIRGFWVNCTYASILTLLRMAELTGETAGFPADVPRAR